MRPAFKDYLWGGTKLKSDYNKHSDLDIIAESWELSCHPNGQSTITNGPLAGKTLDFIFEDDATVTAILGHNCRKMTKFPLLIKLIDAQMDLSVQVHPDDKFASKHEGEFGKTEVWIILDCDIGAGIYYGLKRNVSREELANSIKNNTVLELLNEVKVSKGDVFFISPGTIHAIGAGIVIAEIQQNSDVTYRLYDYDRRDADGNPRHLHIEKGVECADLEPTVAPKPPEGFLVSCEYFSVKSLKVTSNMICYAGVDSFQALLVTEGDGVVHHGNNKIEIVKGDCLFIPANIGEYEITGTCELLLSYAGEPDEIK